MRLESVRALKAELHPLVELELYGTATSIAAYGLPAGRIGDVPRILPAVALGVARAGKSRYVLAVRVQHRGLVESEHVEAVRARARNEVDLRFIGRVRKRSDAWFRERHRPLRIGSSIGHAAVTAGTLGCFVRKPGGRQIFVLSNNHVLADENRAARGDPILQPGTFDGGKHADAVADLARFVRLRMDAVNYVDAALGRLRDGVEHDAATLHPRSLLVGVAKEPPDEDEIVEKLGRTTGKTRGRISAFEIDRVIVEYDTGYLRFDDVLEIEPAGSGRFSGGGDSGSLIYTSPDHLARGLLFGASEHGGSRHAGLTYANPLGAVLESLDVELVL